MKLKLAIKEAFNELKKSNIKSALLDSEILISQAINKNREFVLLNSNLKINQKEYFNLQKLVYERKKGKPISYLTGQKFFWKYNFKINDHVLIPRPDTEVVVETILNVYKEKNRINFLEVGVGSGCILLSILKEKKNFRATGIDISSQALRICNINAYKLGVKNRVKLFKSDIDKFSNGKYDLIISNPPYIKKRTISRLEEDIRNFEPQKALDGGYSGYSKIERVIINSSELLKRNGKLILEIGHDQAYHTSLILERFGFYINKISKDLSNKDRCIVATKC